MFTDGCAVHKSHKRIAQLVFLSSFFVLPCPSLSQIAHSGTSQSIKVQVVSNLIVMPGYVND